MGAPRSIWADGDYLYETEDESKLETKDATRYIRSDLVDKLIGYAVHECDCLWHVGHYCTCGLSDLIKEVRG